MLIWPCDVIVIVEVNNKLRYWRYQINSMKLFINITFSTSRVPVLCLEPFSQIIVENILFKKKTNIFCVRSKITKNGKYMLG